MTPTRERTDRTLATDDEVAARARAIFESACQNTDSYHALRLGLARRRALDPAPAHRALRLWGSAAGAAVACGVLVIGFVALRPGVDNAPAAHVVDPDPIAAGTPSSGNPEDASDLDASQAELVQNLDFYRWLAAQPQVAPSSTGSER